MTLNILDYNEEYFPDPEEFKPSRWYGARENDIGMFSFGGRACEYCRSLLERYKVTQIFLQASDVVFL